MSVIPDRMARASSLIEPTKPIKDAVFNGYQRSLSATNIPPSSYDTELSSNGLSLLGLLISRLEGLTCLEISTVVGMDEEELRGVLHKETSLKPDAHQRIERLFMITEKLRSLMQHRVIGWWYRTSDPELNGQSPLELLKADRIADLEKVVNSYFDTSYA